MGAIAIDVASRKQRAIAFLEDARRGAPAEDLQAYMTPDARHHNAYFPAGMEALAEAMVEAAKTDPDKDLEVINAAEDGDIVMVHSRLRTGHERMVYGVVHIFRFEGDAIAELWDLGQRVPQDMPNADGMF